MSTTPFIIEDEHERNLAQSINQRFEANDPLRRAMERLDSIDHGQPDPGETQPMGQSAPRSVAAPSSGRGYLKDIPLQILGGARDAVDSSMKTVGALGDWLSEHSTLIRQLDELGPHVQLDIPEVPAAQSRGTEFVRSTSRFLTGFLPAFRAAKWLGAGATVGSLAAGAATDLATMDANAPTVGNWIESLLEPAPTELKSKILDYIAIHEDDSQAEKKFKHALEGLGLGLLTQGVFVAAKSLRTAFRGAMVADEAGYTVLPGAESAAGAAKVPKLPEADDVTQLANQFRLNVAKQRRVLGEMGESLTEEGSRPIQKAIDEAQAAFPPEGRMTLQQVRDLHPGTALNDSQAIALIETAADSADKLRVLGQAFLDRHTPWERFLDQLSTFAQIEPARLGVEAEAGRTLRVLSDPIIGKRDFIAQATAALRRAEGGLSREQVAQAFAGMKSLDELMQVARNLSKPGWFDLFTEVRVNGLLSAPRSFAANAMGNTAALSENIFERFSAETVGSGAVAPGEAYAMVTGVYDSFGDSLRLAAKSFKGEMPDMLATAGKIESRYGGARQQVFARVIREKLGYSAAWLDDVENIINVPSRALVAADDFYKSIAFQAEVHALARREAYQAAKTAGLEGAEFVARVSELERGLLANPPSYIKEAAQDFALYTTFNREVTGNIAGAVSKFRQTPVGEFVLPFARTPQNIFKFGLERTPAAALLPSVRRALTAGGVERELAMTRMGTGSMVMGLAALATYNGHITGGGPTDAGLKRTLRQTGWQPYSVKVGDKWVSYNRLDPLGGLLGMAADFVEMSSFITEDQRDNLAVNMVVGGVGSVYKNLGSKTFLRGVADLVDALADPDRRLGDALQGAAASTIPFSALLRSMSTAIDPTVRQNFDELRRTIPGLGDNVPPMRDLFGNKILLPVGLGPSLLGQLAGIFIPFAVTTDAKDPVANRLVQMRYTTGALRPKIGDLDLSPKQFDRYQELAGEGMRQQLAKLMLSPSFAVSDKDTQRAMVSGEVERKRAEARQKLLLEFSDLRVQQRQADVQRGRRGIAVVSPDTEQLRRIANPPPDDPSSPAAAIRIAP